MEPLTQIVPVETKTEAPMTPMAMLSLALERTRTRIVESLGQEDVAVDPAKLTDVNVLKPHVLKRCIYGVDVSADLISRVTDAVIDEMTAWQTRPLESVYLVAYLDALVIKVRDSSGVQNKSVYIAVGIRTDGSKEVLGTWLQASEGAKFWLTILTELRQRGVEDILVMCADGLTGLPEAAQASPAAHSAPSHRVAAR